MDTSDLDARFSAIQRLQTIRNRHRPGSHKHDVAEYAIDLALNEGRRADHFLVRNTLRDASNILRRGTRRRPQHFSLDAELLDQDQAEITTLHDRVPDSAPTPAQLCEYNDLESHLRSRLGVGSSSHRRAFDAVMAGETAREFSDRTKLSQSYFKKLKREIRKAACEERAFAE